MNAVVFLSLVNPMSGGNVGSHLLERFKEILDEDRIYDLSNGGPKKALEDHGHKDNLRLIGKFIIKTIISIHSVTLLYHEEKKCLVATSQFRYIPRRLSSE